MSPLIHVHEAVSDMLLFELACKDGEKLAMPLTVETVLPKPTSDALVAVPAASTALSTARVHDTDTDGITSPELSTRTATIGELGGCGESAVEEMK